MYEPNYQSLSLINFPKFSPLSEISNLNSIRSQSIPTQLLQKAIAINQVPTAFLFTGSNDLEKRQILKYFLPLLLHHSQSSEALENCRSLIEVGNHPDILWIEPSYLHQGNLILKSIACQEQLTFKHSPQIRIEQIREINQFLAYPPLTASVKIVVIENAELMNNNAAHAVLKRLEEPGKATFILLASHAELLLPTICSRCQIIPFKSLSLSEMSKVLQMNGFSQICEHPDILHMAQGSPNQACEIWTAIIKIQEIDSTLLQLSFFNQKLSQLLLAAKMVSQSLDYSSQKWLLSYWQYQFWTTQRNRKKIEILEAAKQKLNRASNQLVWEVCLLKLAEQSGKADAFL